MEIDNRRYDLEGQSFPSVGQLRTRIALCATIDRPTDEGGLLRERPGVFWIWGLISPLKPLRQVSYAAAFGAEKLPSHSVFCRVPTDVQISVNHWVFYKSKFSKRWLRVHAVQDINERHRMAWLLCRLLEDHDDRKDPALDPMKPVTVEIPTLRDLNL